MLTEEEQLEMAIAASIGKELDSKDLKKSLLNESKPIPTDPHSIFHSIKAIDHPEPENSKSTTRVQIRFPGTLF
jgi:hypothetical protein